MFKRLDPSVIPERRLILEKLGFDPDRFGKDGWVPPPATFVGVLTVLETFGLSHAECHRVVRINPSLLDHAAASVSNAVLNLMTHGFTLPEIHRIILRCPHVLTTSEGRTDDLIGYLAAFGFDRAVIIDIITAAPATLFASKAWVGRELRALCKRFGKRRTLKICAIMPYILEQGSKNLLRRIRAIASGGYARREVSTLVERYPRLLCQAPYRIIELCQIFRATGTDALRQPSVFAFSPKLLRARWTVIIRRPKLRARKNLLIRSNGYFAKIAGFSRESLLAMDPGPETFRRRYLASRTAA